MKNHAQDVKKNPALRISDKTRMAIKADGTKIPVVDSEYSFLVQPTFEDIEGAIPLDHMHCMYCRACARQFGSELVWVTRGLAYVELKNKHGKPELRRFILTNPAKAKIRDFDKGSTQVTPESVIFAAPTGSQRLDAIHLRKMKSNADLARRRKAYVTGTVSAPSKPKQKVGKPAGPALREKATGMFQFTQKAQPKFGLD
jgi:hypothetical protein